MSAKKFVAAPFLTHWKFSCFISNILMVLTSLVTKLTPQSAKLLKSSLISAVFRNTITNQQPMLNPSYS